MSETDKPGLFRRAVKYVQDANEQERERKRQAEADARAFHEQAVAEHGALLASRLFARKRVEISADGFVRVMRWEEQREKVHSSLTQNEGTDPVRSGEHDTSGRATMYLFAPDAPFEQLRSITMTTQIQDKSAGGRAVAAAASGGLSRLASNEKRLIFLTITTDQQVHTLKDTGGMLRLEDKAALELEAAGQAALDTPRSVQSPAQQAAQPSIADQVRELAGLHGDGLLTDEEFAQAKAKLLSEN